MRLFKEVMIMADLAELESRIERLEEVEAIKRLKYRYFRCLDSLSWDEVIDCFTEDGVVDYGGPIQLQGKEALKEHLGEMIGNFRGVHQGHHPEIDITGEGAARGTWELYVYVRWEDRKTAMRLGGFYHDEYAKERGEWKIRTTRMVELFREAWST